MEIQVTVCDVCKAVDKPTKRYGLTKGVEHAVERDLCEEDAAPIDALLPARTLGEALRPFNSVQAVRAATRALAATPSSAQEKPPAPRTVTKKASAKKAAKAPSRRRKRGAEVVSFSDIEKRKAK